MPSFLCGTCGKSFDVPQSALDKYPGWKPKTCRSCRRPMEKRVPAARTRGATRTAARGSDREEGITTEEVLRKYTDGPQDGVFTDGAAHPNPGPGGWGAVYVRNGEIIDEAWGHEEDTTNNRMELIALIEGCRLVPKGEEALVWTDSQLCFNIVTQWAAGWEKNGWKRKTGAIKNLDLVRTLYAEARQRPELKLRWIKAHSGYRWNEYADSLATAYRRERK